MESNKIGVSISEIGDGDSYLEEKEEEMVQKKKRSRKKKEVISQVENDKSEIFTDDYLPPVENPYDSLLPNENPDIGLATQEDAQEDVSQAKSFNINIKTYGAGGFGSDDEGNQQQTYKPRSNYVDSRITKAYIATLYMIWLPFLWGLLSNLVDLETANVLIASMFLGGVTLWKTHPKLGRYQ